jgi:hypothetical protein
VIRHAKPEQRPTFLVRLRAEPNTDGVRDLRLALKFILRRFHLRAIETREERAP